MRNSTTTTTEPTHPSIDRCSIRETQRLVSACGAALRSVGLGGLDGDGVMAMVAELRGLQAEVDAAIVRLGTRADELAATGLGPGAREALLGSGQVRGSTAGREAARSQLAARDETLAKHMGSGDLGPDHLDALVRHLGRLDDDHLARIDLPAALDGAAGLPADTFGKRLWRAANITAMTNEGADSGVDEGTDSRVDENQQARADSSVRHWFDHRTGRGHIHAELDPERYEAAANAIDQHTASLANSLGAERNANLAAEAFVELITSSGARQARLPHITVVVDQATAERGRHESTVAETGDGSPLTDDALARLCCDAVLQRVVFDERGLPIDVGRNHRTATPAQWTALRSLYSTCAWPGCDRPLSQCQAHHLHHWRDGGPTDLHNVAPLCSHDHGLVHEGGWHIELLPNRALRITRPDGTHYATTSPPTRLRPPPQTG